MGRLLYRLIQLRYEYFNDLSFEDIDVLIAELDEQVEYESGLLIRILAKHSANKVT